ncbi:helix-turn-helix transcriptional regulator [Sphingobium sp. CAP-1]|uniref:helix-turn-helix transcriptional regulator n=1 Tax=Sphingobium sp. CAP-1 TaxID=2676077 RepID=UPI0012BB293B|nr:response regulator transcription factor [Sphingobium sp. CAP-1]QGP80601.1 LuxR family transcriptional regulator [Sphingobium sp. CAP-1]
MQLTSSDETDLLMPLYAGVHDPNRWKAFLSRLQRRTGADHASLILTQGDMPMDQAVKLFSGRDLRAEALRLELSYLHAAECLHYRTLRPGRVYDATELDMHDPEFRAGQDNLSRQLGISDRRVIRIKDQEGASAWLSLTRGQDAFSAGDGALLIAVAPHMAIALRNFVETERMRVSGTADGLALDRVGVGWIAFDREARVVAMNGTVPVMPGLTVGERLRSDNAATRQALLQMAAEAAKGETIASRLVALSDAPPLHAVLTPLIDRPPLMPSRAVLIALCRRAPQPGAGHAALLADQFTLPRREAELALAMSNGLSISDAATMLGISLETARNYSKRVYAKTGTSGQPDLVRLILSSSAMLG